ncbi:MAG: SPOR domain-containing protein [Bacteroidota bacterium]|nr:MAG: SPOR domain-containing protein [Bacteroidota bacterium]
MEDLIIALLKENGRIIVPDFGAFIVKTRSPFKVIFNEFLQYNDGVLVGAMAEKYKLEPTIAAKKVSDFVKHLNASIDKGEAFPFPVIGFLAKSSSGKIYLSDSLTEDDHSKKPEPSSIMELETNEIQAQPTIETKQTPEPKPETQPAKPDSGKSSFTEPVKPVVIKNPEPIPQKNVYYEEGKKNSWVKLMLWAVVLIVVNGSIIGYFLFNEQISSLFSKKNPEPETIQTTVEFTDSSEVAEEIITGIVNDSTPVIGEPTQTPTSEKTIIGTKYYVVAGVFREEANADKLVEDLMKKGYKAEKFGRIGNSHAVCYDVFASRAEADQFAKKVRAKEGSETWVRAVE